MQLHYLLKSLILPPAALLLLALLGLLLAWRWRRVGLTLLVLSLVSLWLLATPKVSGLLLHQLQQQTPPLSLATLAGADGAQVIVVLGGGQRVSAGEFGDTPTIKALSLERLRYAALLQRATDLPIVAAGGRVYQTMAASEAQMMAEVLQRELGAAEVWPEDGSRTTWENAVNTAALLHDKGLRRILLVTHSWHMPRAVWSFRQQGLEVIPAGVGYLGGEPEFPNPRLLWVPSAAALQDSYYACHEWLGLQVYRWQHR